MVRMDAPHPPAGPAGPPGPAEPPLVRLLRHRAEAHWLRGDRLLALAAVGHVNQGRYRVQGLDDDGIRGSALGNLFDAAIDTEMRGIVTAVRGDHPDCAAAGLYGAAGFTHAWLAITPHRVAVLRLRDVQDPGEGVADNLAARSTQGRQSLLGSFRDVGRLLKATAADARGPDRPPLDHRPQDAAIAWPFEVPYAHLHSIAGWQPPLIRPYPGGPRHVQVHFVDGSWARLQTDEAGAAALLPGG
jgi:hypothetical protein